MATYAWGRDHTDTAQTVTASMPCQATESQLTCFVMLML